MSRLRATRKPRKSLWRRALRGALVVKLLVIAVLALVATAFLVRLGTGPMQFAGLSERLAEGLREQLGADWTVTIDETALTLLDRSLALEAAHVVIRNPSGVVVARAPQAIVSVDTWSALRGAPQPRFVEFRDLQLKARVGEDGSFALLPAGDAAPLPPAPDAAPVRIQDLLAYGTGAVLQPSGLIGALGRARLVNSRLTLVDERGRERVGFERVDADFEREGDGARLDAMLKGPSGTWSLVVDARNGEDGGRNGTVEVQDVPVDDLLLLSGLAHLKGRSNLKVAASARIGLAGDGALQRLDARAQSGPGRVTLPEKAGDVVVQSAAMEAVWDPQRSAFAVRDLGFEGDGTSVRLAGELVEEVGGNWRLNLTGRDGRVSGLTPADRPVVLEKIALAARGTRTEAVVEQLEVKGPDIDGAFAFSTGSEADRGGYRLALRVQQSDARAVLRLWPATIEPELRLDLAKSIPRGRVTSLSIDGLLTSADLEGAAQKRGMAPEALTLTFAGEGVEYRADGMPRLTGGQVSGRLDGRSLSIAAPSARAVAEDGRSMGFLDARYTIADVWPRDAVARLSFRLDGDADALAALLNAPALRDDAGPAHDPALIKGKADLKVEVVLPVDDPPRPTDLELSVTGRLVDFSADRIVGKERLEGANLAVSHEAGTLLVKGEGRLSGSPATLEVRQPRGGTGEAVVSMTLDEAARARRGLPGAPDLTGPLPVRVVTALGKGARGVPTRIEMDLTRAAIDDLIPGWSKAAGRPGKVSFTSHETAPELRNIQLEAGAVQIRGTATLNAEGGIDKADLSTFKLSPGDDLRLGFERAGNVARIAVRGNTGDVRPFLRYMREPAASGRGGGAKDGADIDVDAQVNILTGHNDEAVTRTILKAAIRNRELREAEFTGRFTGAAVNGRVVRQGGGSVLVMESGDAGATLRFLDLYRRMVGGDFQFQMGLGGARQGGAIRVRNFVLRNEPALARIITQQPQGASAEAGGTASASPVNVSEVGFTRARADFTKTGTRIELRDAVISGLQVGFTVGGSFDQVRDAIEISGTFVPAYGLNNVFAQVPLIGPILGGGSNEGLFAVNFRLSGKASTPTLTVNPLSAIAPGIFRKLFGAGGAENDGPLPPLPER